jgi:quercetin dioxygenase-like cupin family protein
MARRDALHRWDDIPLDKVTEMVARKVIDGRRQTMAQVYLKKGALVPVHAHDGDQMTYVLQGALRMVVDREALTVREGDVLCVPSGAAHQAEALDDSFVLTVEETCRS